MQKAAEEVLSSVQDCKKVGMMDAGSWFDANGTDAQKQCVSKGIVVYIHIKVVSKAVEEADKAQIMKVASGLINAMDDMWMTCVPGGKKLVDEVLGDN